jgi:AraC family transcriptional regulator
MTACTKIGVCMQERWYFCDMKISAQGSFLCSSMNTGNVLVYSKLNELFHEWKGGHSEVGIKYVISGEERYVINKKTQLVSEGCFLLVNKGQPHEVSLAYNARPVEGLCMSVEASVLSDVLNNYSRAEEMLLDTAGETEEQAFDFFEGVYRPDDLLSHYISSLGTQLDPATGQFTMDNAVLFYELATRLLLSQSLIKKKVLQIGAQRYSTRKELYERISRARSIIDEQPGRSTMVAELSKEVAMSEFHFFRTFRQVYGISPHQYQLKRKLEEARKMLLKSKVPITEIAFACGFADVPGFSKSFKKAFGVSPLVLRNTNNLNLAVH